MDALYDVTDVETACRDLARAQIAAFEERVYAGAVPPKAALPYALLTVHSPRLDGGMMSGDQQNTLTLGWIVAANSTEQAARLGSDLRALFVGRDGTGGFSSALPLPDGLGALHREGNGDGAPDNVGGLPQWSESAQLVIARA